MIAVDNGVQRMIAVHNGVESKMDAVRNGGERTKNAECNDLRNGETNQTAAHAAGAAAFATTTRRPPSRPSPSLFELLHVAGDVIQ